LDATLLESISVDMGNKVLVWDARGLEIICK